MTNQQESWSGILTAYLGRPLYINLVDHDDSNIAKKAEEILRELQMYYEDCPDEHLPFTTKEVELANMNEVEVEKKGVIVKDQDVLLEAAKNGNLEGIKRVLVKDGMNVNDRGEDGYTALMNAGQNGHLDAFKCLLLEYNADPSLENARGESLSAILAEQNQLEILKCLWSNSSHQQVEREQWVALAIAAARGHLEIVAYLAVHQQVPLDAHFDSSASILMFAAMNNK